MTIRLPNLRRMYVPDPGYIICEIDLSGADAQVVAWEANDLDLMKAFRAGLRIHSKNARDIFGPAAGDGEKDEISPFYKRAKIGVHLSNYGGKPPTLALSLGLSTHEAQAFQNTWFDLHPNILLWHERIEGQLLENRTVKNAFGYRRVYFDRIEGLLGQALAWIPQSTVALITFKVANRFRRELPWLHILLQVHDSLVFQIPYHRVDYISQLQPITEVPVPYPDPLIIPFGLKMSRKSWGDAKKVAWDSL